jgi:L-threonylcarbamoyladenylate synthase
VRAPPDIAHPAPPEQAIERQIAERDRRPPVAQRAERPDRARRGGRIDLDREREAARGHRGVGDPIRRPAEELRHDAAARRERLQRLDRAGDGGRIAPRGDERGDRQPGRLLHAAEPRERVDAPGDLLLAAEREQPAQRGQLGVVADGRALGQQRERPLRRADAARAVADREPDVGEPDEDVRPRERAREPLPLRRRDQRHRPVRVARREADGERRAGRRERRATGDPEQRDRRRQLALGLVRAPELVERLRRAVPRPALAVGVAQLAIGEGGRRIPCDRALPRPAQLQAVREEPERLGAHPAAVVDRLGALELDAPALDLAGEHPADADAEQRVAEQPLRAVAPVEPLDRRRDRGEPRDRAARRRPPVEDRPERRRLGARIDGERPAERERVADRPALEQIQHGGGRHRSSSPEGRGQPATDGPAGEADGGAGARRARSSVRARTARHGGVTPAGGAGHRSGAAQSASLAGFPASVRAPPPPPQDDRPGARTFRAMTAVLPPTPDALDRAARALRDGALVGLPTETVYGVAANALDPAAVARIYAAKDRPAFNPLIVHVGPARASLDRLHADGVIDLDRLEPAGRAVAERLAARWPGPLTLVLPRGPRVPDLTSAGLDTVAVRCPDHPVAQALLDRLDVPLAAPSANRSGRISPTTAEDAAAELGDRLALVLDGGPCAVGLESTVVHVAADGAVTLLRPGALSHGDLAALAGVPVAIAAPVGDRPRSPGMTSRHYAPEAPFFALPAPSCRLSAADRARVLEHVAGATRIGVLTWTAADAARAARCWPRGEIHALALTTDGDPAEAARRLFATLRALDALGADVLLCEPCPPTVADAGLGHAVADRLRRATRPLNAPDGG